MYFVFAGREGASFGLKACRSRWHRVCTLFNAELLRLVVCDVADRVIPNLMGEWWKNHWKAEWSKINEGKYVLFFNSSSKHCSVLLHAVLLKTSLAPLFAKLSFAQAGQSFFEWNTFLMSLRGYSELFSTNLVSIPCIFLPQMQRWSPFSICMIGCRCFTVVCVFLNSSWF